MRAKKIDQNQHDIVEELRMFPGVTVRVGVDDIFVGYMNHNLWYEIKNPNCIGKDGVVQPSKIKRSQVKLLDEWEGHYRVVSTLEEILADLHSIYSSTNL
ncbi:MAG: hypothetical protein GY820_39160 [Gammaproteobacteria bacterium]|nr:hypothetical protein [Gammaproteobacteria bacterium]